MTALHTKWTNWMVELRRLENLNVILVEPYLWDPKKPEITCESCACKMNQLDGGIKAIGKVKCDTCETIIMWSQETWNNMWQLCIQNEPIEGWKHLKVLKKIIKFMLGSSWVPSFFLAAFSWFFEIFGWKLLGQSSGGSEWDLKIFCALQWQTFHGFLKFWLKIVRSMFGGSEWDLKRFCALQWLFLAPISTLKNLHFHLVLRLPHVHFCIPVPFSKRRDQELPF